MAFKHGQPHAFGSSGKGPVLSEPSRISKNKCPLAEINVARCVGMKNPTNCRNKPMDSLRQFLLPIFAAAFLLGCSKQKPDVDIWTAASNGNVEAVKQNLASGIDINARDTRGSTPLLAAALTGQAEAAKLLIQRGAKLNLSNNDGSTPLLVAAFFCHRELVMLLLEKGADVQQKNLKGETALAAVTAQWSPELEGFYRAIATALQLNLDLERIQRTRAEIASLLRSHGG